MFKTLQEAFDRTVEHLAAQKKRAVFHYEDAVTWKDESTCIYGSTSNPALGNCAVGCHLPEEYWDIGVGLVDSLVKTFPELMKPGGALHIEEVDKATTLKFWLQLQQAHDNSDSPDRLRAALRKISTDFDLDPNKIATITTFN